MVGTLEALTVFVFAVIPGYAAVLAYEFRSPPLRSRTSLAELARILLASVAVWALAWWLGAEPVIVDLLDSEPEPVNDMASCLSASRGSHGLGTGRWRCCPTRKETARATWSERRSR